MSIRVVGPADFHRTDFADNKNTSSHGVDADAEATPVVNLLAQIEEAAEEMADIVSNFGRFNRATRRNNNVDNDFSAAILDDSVDEKIETLIKHVNKVSFTSNELISYARSLFLNDCDLMQALRELLLSRQLSELKKKKIKGAIDDLNKFVESDKVKSGINIGRVAKRFSQAQGNLSAAELRSSYLRFLTLDVPSGFIYQDWIEQYGCHYRRRLLSFTLNALIADMKSSEPGIHYSEFGPLSSKLTDARVIHTLDSSLNEQFEQLSFRNQLNNDNVLLNEEDIVALYLEGLLNYDGFENALRRFNENYMGQLFVKQRATIIQILRNIYNFTPDNLYAAPEFREMLLDYISSLLSALHEKEQGLGILGEYYKS